MKRCTECKETKELDEFHKNKSRKDGLHAQCKSCRKQSNKQWRAENPEYQMQYQKQWRETNPEYNKQWREENRGKANALVAKYRAAKLQRTPAWLTAEDHRQIEDFYILAKYMEIAAGIPHHVDHIIPLQGENVSGLHVPSNLQVIPASENLSKSNKV